jgi:hypothetical protein
MEGFMTRIQKMLLAVMFSDQLQTKTSELSTALDNIYGDVSGTPNGLIYDLKSDIAGIKSDVTGDLLNFKNDVSLLIDGQYVTDNPNVSDVATFSTLGNWVQAITITPSACQYNNLQIIYTPYTVTTLGTVTGYVKIGTNSLALTGAGNILGSMPNYAESENLRGAYMPVLSSNGIMEGQCGRAYKLSPDPGNYYIPQIINKTINLSSMLDIGKGLSVWVWLDNTSAQSIAFQLSKAGS